MLRFLRYLIEFIAAFVGFIILLLMLLAWRLSASPVTSDFLTPYIEQGVESLVPDSDVRVAATLLTWDNADHSIALHADGVQVKDSSGQVIADIPSLDARMSLIGLLFGQFMPKDLAIDHPQVTLEHTKDGAFVFGGMAVGGAASAGNAKPAQPLKVILRAMSEHLAHSALLHRLAVTRAVFDVHDDITGQVWAVRVPEISIARTMILNVDDKLEFGALDGHLLFEVTQKETNATLNVNYAYDPAKKQHTLSSVFSDLNPAFLAGGHPETLGLGAASMINLPLTGKVQVVFDKTMDIEAASAQIHGDAGQIVYADFWDQPCAVAALDAHADYDRDAHKLTVSDTRIDFNGPVISVTVDGTPPVQSKYDLDYAAHIEVNGMPMNSFSALWPKPVLADAREWMVANLHDGNYPHSEVALKGSVAWNDLANFALTEGSGKVAATGGRVTYMDGMPDVKGVSANATFDLNQMNVQILGGAIGAIYLSPFTMQINGLSVVDQDIAIPLQVGGPLPDVLRLLDSPPLQYAKALGIAPSDVAGSVQGTVNFKFPLLKTLAMKDVDLHATATASNVASTKLVPGVTIEQGNLGMTLDMSGFTLKGQANLDKIQFQVTWQENFEKQGDKPLQQATLSGVIKEDQWANIGITAFNGTKGPVNATLNLVRPTKNRMRFTGVLDMTPAFIQVDMLGWRKAANLPATLKFSADAVEDKPVQVTDIELRGDRVIATGKAVFSSDMKDILSLTLPRLTLGRTDAAVSYSQTPGPAGSVRIDASGAALDISGIRGDTKDSSADAQASSDARPQELHVNLEHLYTSATGEIQKAHGVAIRDANGWSSIDLRGIVGKDKPLTIALTPQPDGTRVFAINCDDFGQMMQGLGFTDTVKGGKLSVVGQSKLDQPRLIIGNTKISSFTVEKLPVLALLLNATSPFGFTGILTDSADFSRFEGEYTWQGDDLTLTKAHAAGSAIGINIDGKVNLSSGESNLQGTLVPFSVMNNMLNFIPVIGGIITGGENQGVLAVSYTITGPLGSPHIGVNPVSLLTPGFLRNLFFRDSTDDLTTPQ